MNRLYLALGGGGALAWLGGDKDYVVSDRDAEKLRADQTVENYTTTKASSTPSDKTLLMLSKGLNNA